MSNFLTIKMPEYTLENVCVSFREWCDSTFALLLIRQWSQYSFKNHKNVQATVVFCFHNMLNKSWWKQTSLVPDLKRKSVQSFTIEYDIFCGLYVYGIYYMKVISFCSYSVKKEGLFRKGCWIFNNIYLLVWLHQVLVAVRVLLWDLSCFLMSSFLDTDFLHCTTFAVALKSLYVVFYSLPGSSLHGIL